MAARAFVANGRRYGVPPAVAAASAAARGVSGGAGGALASRPRTASVVVCADGHSNEYIDAGIVRGLAPRLAAAAAAGQRFYARCALPSFTNVNNTSIITGVPPSVHGIAGNYCLLPSSSSPSSAAGREDLEPVLMQSPSYLRVPETVLSAAVAAGWRVAVLTAKDKLTRLLGAHVAVEAKNGGGGGDEPSPSSPAGMLCTALELPDKADADLRRWTRAVSRGQAEVGLAEALATGATPLDVPTTVYSTEASMACMRVAAVLVEKQLVDLVYVSTTDFIQHKYAPEEDEALRFTGLLDEDFGRLVDAGASVAVTADHGMSAKHHADGSPHVVYLRDEIAAAFPQLGDRVRVILPITDPYVVHHGALGSFACVYVDGSEQERADVARHLLTRVAGVTEVHDRDTAAPLLELPPDRIGDLVVLSGKSVAVGSTEAEHELSHVANGLRSHGGRYEEAVPLFLSHPIDPQSTPASLARAGDVRNFDAFDFAINAWRPAPAE